MNNKLKEAVELRLSELSAFSEFPNDYAELMRYSLLAGGKRLRAVLHLMGYSLVSDDLKDEAFDFACAIEMIHTYSLIHDDLPAMDNDSLRRGRPTCHIAFGEANAILAGDGLLTYAFEVMSKSAAFCPKNGLTAMQIIASSAGIPGMVRGQYEDMRGGEASVEWLTHMCMLKTGALIAAAVASGAALAGANDEQIKAAYTYGRNIGLAFQIIDDILDNNSTAEELGKTPGKDNASGKVTFYALLGDKAMELAVEHTEAAKEAISIFGETANPLISLADEMLLRRV